MIISISCIKILFIKYCGSTSTPLPKSQHNMYNIFTNNSVMRREFDKGVCVESQSSGGRVKVVECGLWCTVIVMVRCVHMNGQVDSMYCKGILIFISLVLILRV